MATRRKPPKKKVSHAKVVSEKTSDIEKLQRKRFAQISRAYSQRLRPRMSKAAASALALERDRQIALTRRAYASSIRALGSKIKKPPAKKKKRRFEKIVPHTFTVRRKTPPPVSVRGIPIGGVPHLAPKRRVVQPPRDQLAEVSQHWSYFYSDGRPAAPWDLEIGPGVEDEGVMPDFFDLERMFSDDDYSYENLEVDWGGYEHSDTGYPDENA